LFLRDKSRGSDGVKKLPYLSSILLWLTYLVLGWRIYQWATNWRTSLLAALLVLLMAIVLTSPATVVDFFVDGFLRSDVRAFISVIIISIVLILAVVWFPIFAHFLVLISAALLARLDMQISGFKRRYAFAVLACISLSGLATGLWLHFMVNKIEFSPNYSFPYL
jgi:hypothetical protein